MKSSLLSGEIVEPYAEALMSLAVANNLADDLGKDIRSLVELLENSQELRDFLSNPVIADGDKKKVLGEIMRDAHTYLKNFLNLVVDKKRSLFLEGIGQRYLAMLRDRNQTVLAEVSAATKLSGSQRDTVIDKVKQISNARDVELKTTIDPDLIGGVIIKVGSQVLDASLRGQLRRIGVSLTGAA